MAITAEWIINSAKKRIYAISHAKAVVRGNSTVDADLSVLEQNITQFQNSVNELQDAIDSLDLSAIENHLTVQLNSETGAHGFRYYNDELQYTPDNGTSWITIETGAGGLPPMNMKVCEALYGLEDTSVVLKGADPDDTKTAEGTIAKWQGTKIVRKVGSYPTKVSDGTLVVDYQVKDQYKTTGFTDTGLVVGTTYYYRWFPYSDQGAVNMSTDEKANRAKIVPQFNIVGVTADWANNTYTRTDKAVGLSAGTPFDKYKMFGQRRRCIVADDKTILAFHGDDAYTETGKTTVSITKNGTTYAVGTSAQVMVYQPKFYYKVTPVTVVANPYGTGYMIRKATYQVAEVQYDGFKLHPNFKRNGVELPYILQSAFEACTQNSSNSYITNNQSLGNRLASIAGALPSTCGYYNGSSYTGGEHSFTRAVARNLAKARGNGWQIGDMLTAACSQLLFMVEYATMDSQTAIGKGNVDATTSDYSSVIVTGGTSSLGNKSGKDTSKTDGLGCVSYRGEENLWGNVWTWQDGGNGYNSNTGILYWADSNFADDKTTSPYQSSGFNFARANGYVSAFGYSAECDFMFIACEVSGDSANPVGDSFYQGYSNSSMTTAFLGGFCLYGSQAGLFLWGVSNASSGSAWHIGSRLVCVPDATAVEELDVAA